MENLTSWAVFIIVIVVLLAVDLYGFQRKGRQINVKSALIWSAIWIAVSLLFNLGVYYWYGTEKAIEFLTGYLIEKSLSLDNIFVFYMLFTYFSVPLRYQRRVLFWGILGALIMRAILIAAGISLIHNFHWIIYIFGAFLILTGIRMMKSTDEKVSPEKNLIVRLFKKFFQVSDKHHGERFFIKQNGKILATPLFVTLLAVETTDLIFAVDSIPAIFAITTDPFIVYTSNIFAILGLRALYFALAGIISYFSYLKYGLSIVLVFVGIKMVIVDFYKIPVLYSLGFISIVLISSIAISLFKKKPTEKEKARL
ncbi:MAG: TerC/Alx family metal homeostasis membrane protein [candidate division Zixibacteria bacterium]|nr:TerC/Alx family metal homeostasis membrane protein [candidate division Zixibacteria bacterium]